MIYGSDGVDIPHQLLDAQTKDTLVVFAGAGVSVGPPSNLPTFPALVEEIALGAAPKRDREALDEYLGRLEQDGVKIQELTRRILSRPDSRPCQLHDDLVMLFGKWPAPRIVTTNFDPHFTAPAITHFGASVAVYSAPALPRGSEFSGVVHLHGSLARSGDHLVLNDKDFGRAYVTERWATQFLVDMFEAYTVLFVGYSHDDPIMRYLARGLPDNTSRFALTSSDDAGKWRGLGIVPVEYPERPAPHRYAALGETVNDWTADTGRSVVDHAERLKQIGQGPTPVDPATEAYMVAAFQDVVRLQFVVTHARSVDWLRWADSHKLLDDVFAQDKVETTETRFLASWFAEHYAIDHAKEAMAIARKHGLTMCRWLWTVLARRLGSGDPPPAPTVRGPWVVALVQVAPPDWSRWPLGPLLVGCSNLDELPAALLLLNELTRPVLAFGEIRVLGDPYDVDRGWAALYPRLSDVAEQVEDIVTAHIAHAHQLLLAVGAARPGWDPESYRRTTIAQRVDGVREDAFDLLIDIARAFIEWALRERYDLGQRLIARWSTAKAPLLQRLALHGMAHDAQEPPDSALQFIRSRGWLYAPVMRPEVFAAIAHAYPRASQNARASLIRESMRAPVLPRPIGRGSRAKLRDWREVTDLERYNFATWLVRVAPGCDLAAKHLAQLQATHPELEPRPNPQVERGPVTVLVGPGSSPVTVDDLLAKDPASCVDLVVSFSAGRSPFHGPTRPGLLVAMRQAASRSFQWGWQLASALANDDRVPSDVWEALLAAWLEVPESDKDADIVEFLDGHRAIERAAPESVAAWLARRLDRIPAGALSLVEGLIDRLSTSAADEGEDEELPGGDGLWLTAAINHPGGRVTQLWLYALARRRDESGASWTGIPPHYRVWLENAVSSPHQWGAMARIIIASKLDQLHAIDQEWSRAVLLPLFDWERDPLTAEQVWHGFAVWGKISARLLPDILARLRHVFRRLEQELAPIAANLSGHLVGVALYASVDPLTSGWLDEFIQQGGDRARRMWADGMGRELRSLEKAEAEDAWRRWIAQYWERRIMGVPRPLAPGEGGEMVEWMYGLAPVFPDVAGKLTQTPIRFDEHRRVFARLVERNPGAGHPAAVAMVVDLLLSAAGRGMDECNHVETIVRQLISAGGPPKVLRHICESMVRLGCVSGVELAKLIADESA